MTRRGMSLLEVLLALAILGGCLAAIGGLIHLGAHSAVEAREITTAQLLCETKMSEIVAGIIPAEPAGPLPFDLPEHIGWVYYVDMRPLPQPGMMELTVTVMQGAEVQSSRPLMFQLVRWIKDPGLEFADPFAEADAAAEAEAGTTTPMGTAAPMGGTPNGM
jgi:prepilin-type N-terminal cleavage/methylation domain-containing protein